MTADELRRALEAATPKARGIAAALVRRMREPRPAADDIVNAAVVRVINAAGNPENKPITNVEAYLVRSLRSVVLDLIDRRVHEPQLPGVLPPVAAPPLTPPQLHRESGFDCAFAKLEQREKCVLTKVHLAEVTVTVPQGFEACGWTTKSPFHEHKKLKDKFKKLFMQCVGAA